MLEILVFCIVSITISTIDLLGLLCEILKLGSLIVVDGEDIYLYKDGSIHDQMLDSGFREIGNSAWLSLGSEKRFHFNGNLDDVRIYNKALTASEISTLFTNY